MKRKPINLLGRIVENTLNLLSLGPKLPIPIRKQMQQFAYTDTFSIPNKDFVTTNTVVNKVPFVKEKFFSNDPPFLKPVNTGRPQIQLPSFEIPLNLLSQEFLLAHLVLVSIPLLFTGI